MFGDLLSFSLFALEESPQGYPWADFFGGMDSVSDYTKDWTRALVSLMKDIAFSAKNLTATGTGLPLYRYRKDDYSRVYRPAIRCFRRKKGVLSFSVLFTDLPRETTIEPHGVATSFAIALSLSRMLRWGF